MKKLLLLCFLAASQLTFARTDGKINPIIGNQSFMAKYGYAPNENTPDQLRIATHLEYAEFMLRSKDVSSMSQEQIKKRTHLLDLLHEYWTRGVFPKNEDVVNERRPCFIDHNGTICAVGYLVEQTAGHDIAEMINARFMYDEILDMNDPVVLNWIEECGLTREECAVIQPTYDWGPPPRHFVFSYGATYRGGDLVCQSFRLAREGGQRYRSEHSWGVQFDWFYHGDYSAGLRYARLFPRHGGGRKIASTQIGLMPEVFVCDGNAGMNLKPDFGIGTRPWRAFSFNLSYAYAIPLVNEEDYIPGRHEVALRMSVNLNEVTWSRLKPRRKTKTDVDSGQAFR